MPETKFLAKDWIDPDGIIVASGERLARQLIPVLGRGDSARIQMAGLGGVSSSYFNIVLRIVADEVGTKALDRLHFDFSSAILRDIFDRSLAAIREQPTT